MSLNIKSGWRKELLLISIDVLFTFSKSTDLNMQKS